MPDPLVLRYLGHVRFEKRLAERTVTLYTLDLDKLQSLAAQAGVTLLEVGPVHMRRWVSQMHAGGRSARGIALILSGWRGFYVWLGREGLVSSNPVQGLRAPKAAKPLPKALGVDEAVQLASFRQGGDRADLFFLLPSRQPCFGAAFRLWAKQGDGPGLDARFEY